MEINNFRDSFERGEDPLADVTDASDINSVAGVLKLYLRELREPFFPTLYFDQFMEIARKCREVGPRNTAQIACKYRRDSFLLPPRSLVTFAEIVRKYRRDRLKSAGKIVL